jgi:hypothetical protein
VIGPNGHLKSVYRGMEVDVVTDDARSAVLRVLHRLFMPVAADDLATCAHASVGLDLDEESLTALIAEDRAAYFAGAERAAWICPALEYPDGSENDEFVTRSDWQVRARIVDGALSEAQELLLLRRLCDIAASAVEKGAAGGDSYGRLRERIDDLTVHLPEAQLADMRRRRTIPTDDLILYRELAEDLYGERVTAERAAQRDAVEALEQLSPAEKYFGSRG